jgi:hypothetical protein
MDMYWYGKMSQRGIDEQLGSDEPFVPPRCFPSDSPMLGRGEVHVWRAFLNRSTEAQVEILKHTLVAEELRRAGRYRFHKDRERRLKPECTPLIHSNFFENAILK